MQRRKREVRGVDVGGGKRGRLRTERKMREERRADFMGEQWDVVSLKKNFKLQIEEKQSRNSLNVDV
jgi:hypothetical protein